MNKTVARVFLIFFVVGLSFFTIPYAHAQWVPTNGPTGGTVNSIVVKGTDLYAATTIGAFRSTDHGQSWTVNSIMSGGVIALTISDNAIIAASGSAGFFRSTDNGETWTPDSAKIGNTYSTVALVAD